MEWQSASSLEVRSIQTPAERLQVEGRFGDHGELQRIHHPCEQAVGDWSQLPADVLVSDLIQIPPVRLGLLCHLIVWIDGFRSNELRIVDQLSDRVLFLDHYFFF